MKTWQWRQGLVDQTGLVSGRVARRRGSWDGECVGNRLSLSPLGHVS